MLAGLTPLGRMPTRAWLPNAWATSLGKWPKVTWWSLICKVWETFLPILRSTVSIKRDSVRETWDTRECWCFSTLTSAMSTAEPLVSWIPAPRACSHLTSTDSSLTPRRAKSFLSTRGSKSSVTCADPPSRPHMVTTLLRERRSGNYGAIVALRSVIPPWRRLHARCVWRPSAPPPTGSWWKRVISQRPALLAALPLARSSELSSRVSQSKSLRSTSSRRGNPKRAALRASARKMPLKKYPRSL